MRNASGHQCKVKMSGSEKKVNENTYDISSKNRVTKICFWKFHVVVVQSNGKEMYKKSVLHVQSFFFWLLCYTGRFATTIFSATQRYNIVVILF